MINKLIGMVKDPKPIVTPETDPCKILKLVKKDIKRYYTKGWGNTTNKCCVMHALNYRITGSFADQGHGITDQGRYYMLERGLRKGARDAKLSYRRPTAVNDYLGKKATLKMIKNAEKEVCKT